MPVFVHLTSQRNVASIRRNGIALGKRRFRPRGVYALPVTPNFYLSHQWLRELKRLGAGTVVGIYFRIPDEEVVEVGHYNSVHSQMTAAEAVALMMTVGERNSSGNEVWDPKSKEFRKPPKRVSRKRELLPATPEGYEVIIPRKIERTELLRVKALPQVVGWRYMPGAHGRPPCTCRCCERGMYGAGKLLRRVEEAEATGKPTKVVVFGREDDSFRRVERLRKK